jgi:hypothetical protein
VVQPRGDVEQRGVAASEPPALRVVSAHRANQKPGTEFEIAALVLDLELTGALDGQVDLGHPPVVARIGQERGDFPG